MEKRAMPPVKQIDQHAEAAKQPAAEPTIDQVRELALR